MPPKPGEVAGLVPAFGPGEALVALTRNDYYQMGYLAPKGADARIRAEGVEGFRRTDRRTPPGPRRPR